MGESNRPGQVLVMVSFWWSRGDELANHQLGQILTRTGCLDGEITDAAAVDRALRAVGDEPALVAELDEWWQMVAARRSDNTTQNPGLSLGGSIRYLTDRLDADRVTPESIEECRRQIAALDTQIVSAKDLPELAHPDAEMLTLLARYMEARSRVLAMTST